MTKQSWKDLLTDEKEVEYLEYDTHANSEGRDHLERLFTIRHQLWNSLSAELYCVVVICRVVYERIWQYDT